MGSIKDYFSSVGKGLRSLVQGMEVTGREFVTPKITEQYPENRATDRKSTRFSFTPRASARSSVK